MRRMMPSGPGAAETKRRPSSVRWRSTASVRSIAAASTRTLIASTAKAGATPASISASIAIRQMARTKLNRRTSTPVRSPARSFAERRSSASRLKLVNFTPISRLARPAAGSAGLAISTRAQEKGQEIQMINAAPRCRPAPALRPSYFGSRRVRLLRLGGPGFSRRGGGRPSARTRWMARRSRVQLHFLQDRLRRRDHAHAFVLLRKHRGGGANQQSGADQRGDTVG